MYSVQLLFWLSLAILFYCYIGYGIIAAFFALLRRIFRSRTHAAIPAETLPVTLIVTAYREENILQQKIDNILQLEFPREQLKVILVLDEPDPSSLELLKNYPFIELIVQPERQGKYAAIRKAMERVTTPVVVFSDANSLLNPGALKKILVHYGDKRIGAVAGEKKILYQQQHSAVGQAEGWYWEYESFMKKLDAGLYTVVGAAGELFSIRTSLFQPLQQDIVLDDLVVSMQVCMQGYKIAYEKGAFASELPSFSLAEEEKRKVRIAAGAFQSLSFLKDLLHPFYHPMVFFQFMSRRLFRWVLGPLSLIVLLFTNIFLAASHDRSIYYQYFIYLQLGFYGIAFIGYLLIRSGRTAGISSIPFYFLFMNYCLARGFIRFISGKQSVKWEKAVREAASY
jgi:cellulose synthase/poly-beta-1,6-N-acetylglucosamine synthase-like glycosyltransferase